MRCEEALRQLLEARHDGVEPPKDAVEKLTQAECRESWQRAERLDALFALDEADKPRPGFDTRFFSKLKEEKNKERRRILGVMIATLSAGAAAAVVLLFWPVSMPDRFDEAGASIALIQQLELLENFDLVHQLDQVEAFDLLAAVDIETLDDWVTEDRP